MSSSQPTLLVTGATGQLGKLVVAELLKTRSAGSIIATGRSDGSLESLRSQGIQTRIADYSKPETLRSAFAGVDRLLLISSSELGQRAVQHQHVISAAKDAGVKLIVYTSILHADTSELSLAVEHRATEGALRASGIPFVLLRNGWYTENYSSAAHQALASGVFAGGSGEGRISTATRADFAAAAAAVLTSETVQPGAVYELAGDESFTMAQFGAEVAKQSGKSVEYNNLSAKNYEEMLNGFGLPAAVSQMLAQSDDAASRGALFDDSKTLSRLIGRPTTPLSEWVAGHLTSQPTAH